MWSVQGVIVWSVQGVIVWSVQGIIVRSVQGIIVWSVNESKQNYGAPPAIRRTDNLGHRPFGL